MSNNKEDKETKSAYFKIWFKKNRQKHYANLKRYRLLHPKKCKSRSITSAIIYGWLNCWGKRMYAPVSINKLCKICGTKRNLQIHHEIYPIHAKKVRQAIYDGRIYYVCKKHHPKNRKRLYNLVQPKGL